MKSSAVIRVVRRRQQDCVAVDALRSICQRLQSIEVSVHDIDSNIPSAGMVTIHLLMARRNVGVDGLKTAIMEHKANGQPFMIACYQEQKTILSEFLARLDDKAFCVLERNDEDSCESIERKWFPHIWSVVSRVCELDVVASSNLEVVLLSGGGFRATVFHLGVLRFLYEHRRIDSETSILAEVRHIVGVSGGSLTAAHFAQHRSEYLNNFKSYCSVLLNFVATKNVRERLLRENVNLEDVLDELFPGGKRYMKIDSELKLHVLGTRLDTGHCVAFRPEHIVQIGRNTDLEPCEEFRSPWNGDVRSAIRASSAFPPVLAPLVLHRRTVGTVTDFAIGPLRGASIADGGIRDNLGVEYGESQKWSYKEHQIFVSDAGRLFDTADAPTSTAEVLHWIYRLRRTAEIQMQRLSDLDKANSSHLDRISLEYAQTAPRDWDHKTQLHSQNLTQEPAIEVTRIATDLMALSKSQIFSLVRLGYDATADLFRGQRVISRNVPDPLFWAELWPSSIDSWQALAKQLKADNDAAVIDQEQLIDSLPVATGHKRLLKIIIYLGRHWLALLVGVLAIIVTITFICIVS